MRRLPGVNLRDYGGVSGLKTVSVRGLGSEHTAVIYDGVSLSDCQSGQIDLSRYSIDNVRSLSLYSGDNDDIFLLKQRQPPQHLRFIYHRLPLLMMPIFT